MLLLVSRGRFKRAARFLDLVGLLLICMPRMSSQRPSVMPGPPSATCTARGHNTQAHAQQAKPNGVNPEQRVLQGCHTFCCQVQAVRQTHSTSAVCHAALQPPGAYLQAGSSWAGRPSAAWPLLPGDVLTQTHTVG